MANSDSSLIDMKYKQNIDERIETAKTLKNEGNEFYKEKKYRQATGKYHRALLQLKLNMDNVCRPLTDCLQQSPDSFPSYNVPVDYRQTISAIQADCYNNLAACLLHKEDTNYDRIIEYCDLVLAIYPENLKAAFRKCMALYHMKKYEEALEDLQSLSHKHPEDLAIKRYIKLCEAEVRKHNRSIKKTYQEMFNEMNKHSKEVNAVH
ncbi:repeat 9C [Octopus vulgaris]|uniref:Repeat 9C n=2 Tax=Octopus TaxID=6643 RepID=A0AA36FD41_OCTVU|nr:tetratricopeptide repeat protein 9C [Octopus sinensis]CAI9730313.1 repeat 9C [Octopus vulgaris]